MGTLPDALGLLVRLGYSFQPLKARVLSFYLEMPSFSGPVRVIMTHSPQTITTTPGDSYTISFHLNVDEITVNQGFIVDFGTSQLLNLLNNGTNGTQTFDVVASGSSTTLDFLGYNVPANTFLTDVSVTQDEVATPLPAALPLFATGIGALGLLGWRRKRKAKAVA
jgi:hypothetical protein